MSRQRKHRPVLGASCTVHMHSTSIRTRNKPSSFGLCPVRTGPKPPGFRRIPGESPSRNETLWQCRGRFPLPPSRWTAVHARRTDSHALGSVPCNRAESFIVKRCNLSALIKFTSGPPGCIPTCRRASRQLGATRKAKREIDGGNANPRVRGPKGLSAVVLGSSMFASFVNGSRA